MEHFDPAFFGISNTEAETMNPQHRILLEVAVLAFLDAGYTPESLSGKNCGVFVGMSQTPGRTDPGSSGTVYGATGSAASIAAGRVAHFFDLHGATAVYDTACSSSLVALDAAVKALRDGDCDMALVAGVNELFDPQQYLDYATAGMLSRSGHCHTFDAQADGYLRGEGCGAVILTRKAIAGFADSRNSLATSDAAGETINSGYYAAILATCVSHDGRSASITAPNGSAQESLLRTSLSKAKIHPDRVDYFEAHGTGTALGDPIEIEAISNVFFDSKTCSRESPLSIGSVKANIGHLEAGAGIAGLIKAVLVLIHENAPSNAGLTKLNPYIEEIIAAKTQKNNIAGDGSNTALQIRFPKELESLRSSSGKTSDALIAGVSSFGYSGTIAHAILCQPPINEKRAIQEQETTVSLSDGQNSTQEDVASSTTAVSEDVSRKNDPGTAEEQTFLPDTRVAFMFTGQGSQYLGMGELLYEEDSHFREAMDRCEAAYKVAANGESLLKRMFKKKISSNAETAEQSLSRTENAQPALIALEWSLAQMWLANGVAPGMVLGHSVGEIAAACVAGAMSIETAMLLAVKRGHMMQSLPSEDGVMVAIRHAAKDVRDVLGSQLSKSERDLVGVAADNGPRSSVISGQRGVVKKVLNAIGKDGVYLAVSHAFHSPLMKPMEEEFRNFLRQLHFKPIFVPLASTVSAKILSPGELIPIEHWVSQLASPVLFLDALVLTGLDVAGQPQHISEAGKIQAVIEMGSNPVLTRMAKPLVTKGQPLVWASAMEKQDPSQNKAMKSVTAVLEILGEDQKTAMVTGPVRSGAVKEDDAGNSKAGQESVQDNSTGRDFLKSEESAATDASDALPSGNSLLRIFPARHHVSWNTGMPHPLLQRSMPIGRRGVEFETTFHASLLHAYSGHMISGQNLLPAAAMIEMGIAAGTRSGLQISKVAHSVTLSNVDFIKPCHLGSSARLVCEQTFGSGMQLRNAAIGEEKENLFCQIGSVSLEAVEKPQDHAAELQTWRAEHKHEVKDLRNFYETSAVSGFHKGNFQTIETAWLDESRSSVLACLRLKESHEHDGFYCIHPALLDGAIQLYAFLGEDAMTHEAWVPSGLDRMVFLSGASRYTSSHVWARLQLEVSSSRHRVFKIEIIDEGGAVITIEQFRMQQLVSAAHQSQLSLYETVWVEAALPAASEDTPASSSPSYFPSDLQLRLLRLPSSSFSGTELCQSFATNGVEVSEVSLADVQQSTDASKRVAYVVPLLPEEEGLSIQMLSDVVKFLQTLSCEGGSAVFRVMILTVGMNGPSHDAGATSPHAAATGYLIGGSVIGMLRSAAAELDSSSISIQCFDVKSLQKDQDIAEKLTGRSFRRAFNNLF